MNSHDCSLNTSGTAIEIYAQQQQSQSTDGLACCCHVFRVAHSHWSSYNERHTLHATMLCTFRQFFRSGSPSHPPQTYEMLLYSIIYIIPYILYIVQSVYTQRLVFRQQATDDDITRALVLYTILFAAAMVWGNGYVLCAAVVLNQQHQLRAREFMYCAYTQTQIHTVYLSRTA